MVGKVTLKRPYLYCLLNCENGFTLWRALELSESVPSSGTFRCDRVNHFPQQAPPYSDSIGGYKTVGRESIISAEKPPECLSIMEPRTRQPFQI